MNTIPDIQSRRARLEAWLADRIPGGAQFHLSELRAPTGTGNSAETSFATLEFVRDDTPNAMKLVVRRQLSESDLFLGANILLPYRVMAALEQHRDIPSPKVVGVETDETVIGSPFLVMEAIEGRIVDQVPNYHVEGWLADLPPKGQREVWLNALDALAKLHNLDWTENFSFLDDPRRGRPGFEQYLDWTREWYEWARAEREFPVSDTALDYLRRNAPANTDVSVLWGDPTPANTLFRADRSVAALLDFEMVALGPGEVDLAWWLASEENFAQRPGVTRLKGLPDREEFIAVYEQRRGRPVRDMDYFHLFALFRMNTVLIRFIDRLVAAGRMPAGTDAATHNPTTRKIARFLGLPDFEPGDGYAAMLRGMAGAA